MYIQKKHVWRRENTRMIGLVLIEHHSGNIDINSYCSSLEVNSVIKSEVEGCLTRHIYRSDLMYFLSFHFSRFHQSQTFYCRHKFWSILELIWANSTEYISLREQMHVQSHEI